MYQNVLNKRDDENDFEHHKRLVYGKLKDKTLADYDYGEISKYLYGKELAPDETRKRMYGSCCTLELLDNLRMDSISNDDLLSELEKKKIELQKERQRFSDQRREFNKIVNAEGRKEHLFDILEEAASNLTNTIGKMAFNIDDNAQDADSDIGDNEAVLVLSDWHYGMITNNIFNYYDIDTCKKRVSVIVQETIRRIKLHRSKRLHIVILGDLLHGAPHVSTRVASEELVCDQLMQVSELLAQAVITLSCYVSDTNVYITYGNHARTVQSKKDNIHRDNIERIIPWWLEQRIKAEQLSEKIIIHNDYKYEFILFNVEGHTFCASHGDLDSVKASPKQLGLLFHKTCGADIDYILLGDKHHNESFEELGIESIICGSLCGTDEYANTKRLYSKPSQLLLIVNWFTGVDAKYELSCE